MYLKCCLILIFIELSFYLPLLQGATDLYIVKVKQIKCMDIDVDHILNVTCYVKADRHKYGIINVYFEQLNMDHQMVHLKMLIQNSAGRFLPSFLNFQYNFCEWNELIKTGPILLGIIHHVREHYTDTESAVTCPFNVRLRSLKRFQFKLLFKNCLHFRVHMI